MRLVRLIGIPIFLLIIGVVISGCWFKQGVIALYDQGMCISDSRATIRGRILDESNEPVIGGSFVEEKRELGAMTDFDGYFCIRNVPVGEYVFKISHLDYVTQVDTAVIEYDSVYTLPNYYLKVRESQFERQGKLLGLPKQEIKELDYERNKVNTKVSGRVIDENNKPIKGAVAYIKGTKLGDLTDTLGYFSIQHVPFGKNIILYSCLEYHTSHDAITIYQQKDTILADKILNAVPVCIRVYSMPSSGFKVDTQIANNDYWGVLIKHSSVDSISNLWGGRCQIEGHTYNCRFRKEPNIKVQLYLMKDSILADDRENYQSYIDSSLLISEVTSDSTGYFSFESLNENRLYALSTFSDVFNESCKTQRLYFIRPNPDSIAIVLAKRIHIDSINGDNGARIWIPRYDVLK